MSGKKTVSSSDDPQKKQKWWRKVLKYSLIFFLFLFVALLISVSAITHKFGPYMGKVVDLETGEPIEGAAVLMCFKTLGFENSGSYAGAVEIITDVNGEFNIPEKRVFVFHVLNEWDHHGYITIFKPGYGAYPGNRDSKPLFIPNGSAPDEKQITILLPKLESVEERKSNLGDLSVSVWADVPNKKMKNLLELESEERIDIGLSPLPSSLWGD